MYSGKELLVCVLVAMHVSFLASRPTESPDKIANLLERMKRLTRAPMENLLKAEKDYVEHIFGENPPKEYRENTLEPLEGIPSPVGNTTEEIENAVCAIRDYLKEHLPVIIRQLTLDPPRGELLTNTEAFSSQFEQAAAPAASKQCHRNVTTSDSFNMKVTGLKIIHFTKTWLTEFTNTTSSSD